MVTFLVTAGLSSPGRRPRGEVLMSGHSDMQNVTWPTRGVKPPPCARPAQRLPTRSGASAGRDLDPGAARRGGHEGVEDDRRAHGVGQVDADGPAGCDRGEQVAQLDDLEVVVAHRDPGAGL